MLQLPSSHIFSSKRYITGDYFICSIENRSKVLTTRNWKLIKKKFSQMEIVEAILIKRLIKQIEKSLVLLPVKQNLIVNHCRLTFAHEHKHNIKNGSIWSRYYQLAIVRHKQTILIASTIAFLWDSCYINQKQVLWNTLRRTAMSIQSLDVQETVVSLPF